MTLKLNISLRGRAWKLDLEPEVLSGISIGEKIQGQILKPELDGYELEITGGSDFAGFPMDRNVEGIGLKSVLRKEKGFGLKSKPKGLKKNKPRLKKGVRLRKTARGKVISEKTVQLNMKVIKEGSTPLEKVFPEQSKSKEAPVESQKNMGEQNKEAIAEEKSKIEKPNVEKKTEKKAKEENSKKKNSEEKSKEVSGEEK